MGTIRECVRKDGSKSYHAEVRLKGNTPLKKTHTNLYMGTLAEQCC